MPEREKSEKEILNDILMELQGLSRKVTEIMDDVRHIKNAT
jgi:hypothetical protein